MARQDYFTHFEPSQSLGGVKMGIPRKKTPDHPQAEFGLSHMWPELGSNPLRWDDEQFRTPKIRGLNHSAMGDTGQWLCKEVHVIFKFLLYDVASIIVK